jgi:endonuclease III
VKAQEKLKTISHYVASSYRKRRAAFRNYPHDILDLVVFHKFHFYMSEREAIQAFRRLKTAFVDWNEVRISAVKEIQELFEGLPDALELAIFVKDFLEYLHRENQSVTLEFLGEKNLGDIRRYLRGIKGIEPATIDLVLRLRKEHPVVPLSAPMERTLVRLGVVRPGDNRDQKEKYLHAMIREEELLPFHHFLLQHSREICPPDDEKLQCSSCGIRASCSFYERRRRRMNGRSPEGSAPRKSRSG